MTVRRLKLITLPLCALCLIAGAMMLIHSLKGAQLIGCGAGSGCDSVMASQWAYISGQIPVSLPAIVCYLALTVCLLFLSADGREQDRRLDNIIWIIMLCLGASIVGAALWFSSLQIFVLHQFCKYCTFTHLVGSIIAVLILVNCPFKWLHKTLLFCAGLLLAGAFAVVQSKTIPSIVYDNGVSSSQLPTFADDELPCIGPEDAEYQMTLLFDFQCTHCRKLHKILPDLLAEADGKLRIQLCPVSLSSECNPYIPFDGIDRFAGSCTMTKLALAVWFHFPQYYPAVEAYLLGNGDDSLFLSPEEAKARIAGLVGENELQEALQDERIPNIQARTYNLFGRTSSSDKSGVPRFIYGQKWLVPETDSASELLEVLWANLVI